MILVVGYTGVMFQNVLFEVVAPAKASELVPCSLLPHWNSMRFFATVSLYE